MLTKRHKSTISEAFIVANQGAFVSPRREASASLLANTPWSRPKILHVSEAFGGGIVSALVAFAEATNGMFEHHALVRIRRDHVTGQTLNAFRTVTSFENIVTGLLRTLPRLARDLKPDIIHLHSTYAGMGGRIIPMLNCPIVYSPHCFGFERRDLLPGLTCLVRAVERILAGRCVFAAIGDYEAELARLLNSRSSVFKIANALSAGSDPDITRSNHSTRETLTVVMIGRANAQKGVDFFRDVAGLAAETGRFRLVWIGGANPWWEARLRETGVEVTGWLQRSEVLKGLASADIYLHTARWEGTPISLLEAAAAGVPVVARNIPHLRGVPIGRLVDSPADALSALEELCSTSQLQRLAQYNLGIIEKHSRFALRASLANCYYETLRRRAASQVTCRLSIGGVR